MAARFFWGHGLIRIAALSVSFGLIEVLRGFIFTGFPWNSLGMMALTHPVSMQLTAWIGVEVLRPLPFLFAFPHLGRSKPPYDNAYFSRSINK